MNKVLKIGQNVLAELRIQQERDLLPTRTESSTSLFTDKTQKNEVRRRIEQMLRLGLFIH